MGIVNKLFTSVSELYNNVNLLTLSGLNDVIVVEGNDGKLRCTDFQLRFGRLYFPNMKRQTVHLLVNGVLADVSMFITSQGELFFQQDGQDDSFVQYDDVTGFTNKLEEIKNEEMDEFIKIQFEKLNISKGGNGKMESILERTKKHRNYYKKERISNFEKRAFMEHYRVFVKEDFFTNYGERFKKFQHLLTSSEYYNWLIGKYRHILFLFNGAIKNEASKKDNAPCKQNYCSATTISFSLCNDKKIENSVHKTFRSFLIKEIKTPENVVAKIEGCKSCKYVFYFSYSLFCKIFFDLRGTQNNRSKTLLEILENEHNRFVGWSFFGRKKLIKRDVSFSLKMTSKELKSLGLVYGKNNIIFKVSGINKQLEGHIYFWKYDEKVIISDVDGTITKSDIMGKDWTHVGIASLFTKIAKNGYKILYLTARPIERSFATKNYLNNINQDGLTLPDGPVMLSPDGIFAALYREIIIKKPEDFKIACLNSIKSVFGVNPFVAGFGNRITDVITYKALEIPPTRILTINPQGEIYVELSKVLSQTYSSMNEFLDKIFPRITPGEIPFIDHSYSDLTWFTNYNDED